MKKNETRTKPPAWKLFLWSHVPIFVWLPEYKKSDFIADLIAGVTVGLTLIPQSVAYAGLAGLPAEYGLYSSFMGSFVYVVFGSVKEVSIGPTSLISLLTLEFTKNLPLEFVFLLTFMSGCIEFLLGLLQFGFLVNFISIPVTTSFQSATSLIIISSQIKDLLGLPKFKSGRFLNNILSASSRIQKTTMGDTALSIFCFIFLLSFRVMKLKDIKFSNDKKKTKKIFWLISISRNSTCVFICCLVAYVFSLHGKFPFKLSGNIPTGLPPFRFPAFHAQIGNETLSFPEMMHQISPGVFFLPIIAILANITIAKAFSTGSPVNATQEMLTLGLCNISGALVGSMPTCGAFTRSAVSNSSGVRTPLAGLFTGFLIILVIKFLTPYFYYIPKAALASVLICAVIFMIDLKTMLLLWKVNKKEFFCSTVTFSCCLIFGVQIGLVLGVAVSNLQLLYVWARPSIFIQVKTLRLGSCYWVKPDVGLFYPAVDFLRNEITQKCILKIPVVIDCLHFKGIDYTTAQGIKDLEKCCQKKEQKLLLINLHSKNYNLFRKFKVNLNLQQLLESEDLNDVLFRSGEPKMISAILLEQSSNAEIKDPSIGIDEKSLI